jgi:hypothetical protein
VRHVSRAFGTSVRNKARWGLGLGLLGIIGGMVGFVATAGEGSDVATSSSDPQWADVLAPVVLLFVVASLVLFAWAFIGAMRNRFAERRRRP